jgi:hypothetical protein
MLKKILAAAALAMLIAMAPTFAQEQPATTPAPEAEQPGAATPDTTKKPEPAAHPRRVHHYQYSRHYWPWDWAWYQLRRELRYLQHHRI